MKACLRHLGAIGIALLVLVGPFARKAHAFGQAGAGTVTRIDVTSGGVVMFYLTSTHSGAPACHNSGNRWAIDGTTNGGKAMLSVIQGAYLSGRTIAVAFGSGDCALYGGTETATYINTPSF